MKTNIELALIGCGRLGDVHAECIAKIDGARFVAYMDAQLDAAKDKLARYGGRYATDDVSKILGDDSIDAVYICTRHDSHAPLAIAAANAGKHILIEKPLALSIEDCEEVAAAVDRAGVTLMPAFKMRYYPLIRRAKAFIPEPTVLVGQLMDNRWADDRWPQDPVQGGANVHSQGCHMADLLRYLANAEPTELWAVGGALTHPGHPCIDHCLASIKFDNGHVASWINGDAAMPAFTSKFFIEMFGEGKSVQLYDRFKKATFTDGERTWTEQRDEEEGFMIENQVFIEALRQGKQPDISARDGIQATRIVLAADRAIRTGQVQTIAAADQVLQTG